MHRANQLVMTFVFVFGIHVIAHAAPLQSAVAPTPQPIPAGLTEQGRLLWDFEGLLRKAYGSGQLCVSFGKSRNILFKFTPGDCSPLSTYETFRYMFARPYGSPFRLSSRSIKSVFFGNHLAAVVVRGHLVECRAAGPGYLIDFTTGFPLWLGCSTSN